MGRKGGFRFAQHLCAFSTEANNQSSRYSTISLISLPSPDLTIAGIECIVVVLHTGKHLTKPSLDPAAETHADMADERM